MSQANRQSHSGHLCASPDTMTLPWRTTMDERADVVYDAGRLSPASNRGRTSSYVEG